MLIFENEVRRCGALVKSAFPRFGDWEFINERHADYVGFTVWGCYQTRSERPSTPRFFVTFDCCREKWEGHLSVGKHCYFWSSADVGDAFLLNTGRCISLEVAISTLRRRIAELFGALLGSEAELRGPADVGCD